MDISNWYRQSAEQPLFADLIWQKPQTKSRAGKLLIIGGNLHGFSAPGIAFKAASDAGIGTIRILLPNSLKKFLDRNLPEADYTPSTQSGSFSKAALAQFLDNADWADGVLIAGDVGRNSETAILLDNFIDKYQGLLSFAGDSLDYFLDSSRKLLDRQNTLLIAEIGMLQKMAKQSRPSTPILHKMNLSEIVTIMADWTNSVPTVFVTKHSDNLLLAYGGKVCTTHVSQNLNWQAEIAAHACVWWIQQPQKPFEAIASAVYEFLKQSA